MEENQRQHLIDEMSEVLEGFIHEIQESESPETRSEGRSILALALTYFDLLEAKHNTNTDN